MPDRNRLEANDDKAVQTDHGRSTYVVVGIRQSAATAVNRI